MARVNKHKRLKKIFYKYTSWRFNLFKWQWYHYPTCLSRLKNENLDESDLEFLLNQTNILETTFKERHTYAIYFSIIVSLFGGFSIQNYSRSLDKFEKADEKLAIVDKLKQQADFEQQLKSISKGFQESLDLLANSFYMIVTLLFVYSVYSIYVKLKYQSIVTFKEALQKILEEINV
ncbi:hypothetical protein J5TS2_40670 [Brevibacillus halotolerans]|uniref:hypothetical protein n=1 Tax=Brevibacillus halotolerans TaxID=1507437 RepID=UPI001B04B785|nr:hypothetical protein [Brevibacillus halotolerans]GIO03399.1 hypothetical protein J5TS2_40670 [Brevibacillus halotolerans]